MFSIFTVALYIYMYISYTISTLATLSSNRSMTTSLDESFRCKSEMTTWYSWKKEKSDGDFQQKVVFCMV